MARVACPKCGNTKFESTALQFIEIRDGKAVVTHYENQGEPIFCAECDEEFGVEEFEWVEDTEFLSDSELKVVLNALSDSGWEGEDMEVDALISKISARLEESQ